MEPDQDLAEATMYAALDRGLSFKTTMGNVLTLTPPLTITEDEMLRALDIVAAAIEDAQAEMSQQRSVAESSSSARRALPFTRSGSTCRTSRARGWTGGRGQAPA